jgi:Ca-activated chloride channel family protein
MMLEAVFKPHRRSLRAGTPDPQKVFAMLRLIPQAQVALARPPVGLALVVDTSGSMQVLLPEGRSKVDRAIQAAHAMIDDDRLEESDWITIVQFDHHAQVLLPLLDLGQKATAHWAVERLREFSGGTKMGLGLRCARDELSQLPPEMAKRVFVLTDGVTQDEPDCLAVGQELAVANAPIVALGIDEEYNEELLLQLAAMTQGRPYHLEYMGQLSDIMGLEVSFAVQEVVTNVQATVSLVEGVTLDSLTRVYPSLAEVPLGFPPYALGNVAAGDDTVFVAEFTVSGLARQPVRFRLAEITLDFHVPGMGLQDRLPPQTLFVHFTDEEAAATEIDLEVLGYVQQRSMDRLVQEALRAAPKDPEQALQTLQSAMGLTQQVGNVGMTQMLQGALDELRRTGQFSAQTSKRVRAAGRTQTMKTRALASPEALPSEEEIRRLTGT